MINRFRNTGGAATLIYLLHGGAIAPTLANQDQTIQLEQTSPIRGSFSELKFAKSLENQIDFWKQVYTATSDAVIFHRDTFTIIDTIPATDDAKGRAKAAQEKNSIEELLVKKGEVKKGGLGAIVGKAGTFQAGYERISPWLMHMKRQFASTGIHPQMAYQAVLESNFNPNAISHANAVGAYQFLRPIATHFLMVNSAIDERLDPVRQAKAAALLLKANFARYGSEELAIGAYHSGNGNYDRAVIFARRTLESQNPQEIFAHIVKNFQRQPREIRGSYRWASSSYVPGMAGVLRGIQEQFPELKPDLEKEFDSFRIAYTGKRKITIDEIIAKDIVKTADIKDLNPAILYLRRNERAISKLMPRNPSRILPDGYELRVPADMATKVQLQFSDRLIPTKINIVRARANIDVRYFETKGDLAYRAITSRRMRGENSLITAADLAEIKNLYSNELLQSIDPELRAWISDGIKIINYDISKHATEKEIGYWSTMANYAHKIPTGGRRFTEY